MELAYIWVSKFRNIENQGFNISSRYEFQYSLANQHLIIGDRPNKLENFFDDNSIVNVTALIGQNASGKTNVLELINYALDEGNTKIAKPFFIVLFENDDFIIVKYQIDNITTNLTNGQVTNEVYNERKHFDQIYFSNVFDGRRHNFGKGIFDLSSNRLLQNQFGENVLTNFKKDIQSQIIFINSPDFTSLQNVEDQINPNIHFDLRPTHIDLISPTWSNILSRARAFDKKIAQMLNEDYTDFKEFCMTFRKKITDSQSGKSIYYFTAFLLYVDFIINEFAPQVGNEIEGKGDDDSISPETAKRILKFEEFVNEKEGVSALKDELLKLNLQKLKDRRINEIHNIITFEMSGFIQDEFPKLSIKSKFLIELGKFEYEYSEKQNEGTYSNRKVQFHSEYNSQIELFIKRYLDAVTSNSLMYTIDWHGMSSGHKAFLNLFSRFYSIKDKIKLNNIIITIDEGDLYFHPKWQIEFLYKLLKVLPIIFRGKNVQLILTTHSPFLVSDLTKNNLIFLKKENDLCKVIPSRDIVGETFGGNIGELYLDAFFLNGNLISQFAISKIKKLFANAKGANLSPNDISLIEQIGEEIIKSQLLKLANGFNTRQIKG